MGMHEQAGKQALRLDHLVEEYMPAITRPADGSLLHDHWLLFSLIARQNVKVARRSSPAVWHVTQKRRLM